MAYAAKCDTAAATKWWITGTGSVVNRLSEVMDDNAAGVEEDDNPGNFQPWTTFMTETVEDRIYMIHLKPEFGDGTTSTTLISINEHVFYDDGVAFQIMAEADVSLGIKQNDWGMDGAFWSIAPGGNIDIIASGNGIFNIYAGMLTIRDNSELDCDTGTQEILNSIVCGSNEFAGTLRCKGTGSIKRTHWTHNSSLQTGGGIDIDNVHIHYCANPINSQSGFISIPNKVYVTATQVRDLDLDNASSILAIDPVASFSTIRCQNALDAGKEAYTVNIHMRDKGNNLAGVAVLIEDTAGNIVGYTDSGATITDTFIQITDVNIEISDYSKLTAGDVVNVEGEFMYVVSSNSGTPDYMTVTRGYYNNPSEDGHEASRHTVGATIYIAGSPETDAGGDILEQIMVYKQWHDTDEGLSTFSPHKFTFSKPGYQTLVKDNITINKPIVWDLELQPIRSRALGRGSRRAQVSNFE